MSHRYISSSGKNALLAKKVSFERNKGSLTKKDIGAPVLPMMTTTASTNKLKPALSSMNPMHTSSLLVYTLTQSFFSQKAGCNAFPHVASPLSDHSEQSIVGVESAYGKTQAR